MDTSDDVIQAIIEDSCTLLGPSLRTLVDDFRAGLNESVGKAFRACSIVFQFHAIPAIEGSALRLSDGVASDDDDGCTKG